jgi:hypothetical protein
MSPKPAFLGGRHGSTFAGPALHRSTLEQSPEKKKIYIHISLRLVMGDPQVTIIVSICLNWMISGCPPRLGNLHMFASEVRKDSWE